LPFPIKVLPRLLNKLGVKCFALMAETAQNFYIQAAFESPRLTDTVAGTN
jgi:hypothetical protein